MDDLGVVQHHADHTGGGQHHVALPAIETLGDGRRHPPGGVGAGPAGEGVGAAGIDDQGLDLLATPGLQLAPAPVDRSRTDRVAGEYAGAGRALRKAQDQQILTRLFVKSRAAGRQLAATDRRNGREPDRQGRDLQTRLAGRRLGRSRRTGELAAFLLHAPERRVFEHRRQRIEGAFQGLADDLGRLGGGFQRLGGGVGAGRFGHGGILWPLLCLRASGGVKARSAAGPVARPGADAGSCAPPPSAGPISSLTLL